MTSKRKPIPKTQQQLSFENGSTYLNTGKVPYIDSKDRIEQISRKGDTFKDISIGIKDIDEAILYYFTNIIQPSVIQNGQKINVPILYGSPERWAAVQKDGYYRDKNGKIQAPLIMFKRNTLVKKRNLSNKLDGNQASNFYIYKSPYSKRNVYDRFSTLSNRAPSEEYYAVVIPDFVTVEYSCVVFTDYVEQNNKLIESINFASDSYWGNPERFKFRSTIDTFNTVTELPQGQDRGIKTSFTITLDGYIIPDSINKSIATIKKFYSKSRIDFKLETEGSLEVLEARARTPQRQAKTRFFDQALPGGGGTGTTGGTLSPTEISFIVSRSTALADLKSGQVATFLNKSFITPPVNYPALGIEDFEIYVNGRRVPSSFIIDIIEAGSSIEVTIDTTGFFEEVGAVLRSNDEVLIVGKIQ